MAISELEKTYRDHKPFWTGNVHPDTLSPQFRDRYREFVSIPDGTDVSEEAVRNIQIEQMLAVVRGLRPRHREVLIHVFWEHLPFEDIGKAMGISETGARDLTDRALKAARNELFGNGGQLPKWRGGRARRA